MKTDNKQKHILRAYIISTLLTNISRQSDSKPNSGDNLRMIEGFIATGGWSPEFPAKLSPMTAWPFEKQAGAMPNGCSAQEYVDSANKHRVERLAELEAILARANNNDSRDKAGNDLDAYREIYCEGGKLIKLTVKNAYWASSGHQRSEFVIDQAYTEWRRRHGIAAAANGAAGLDDKFPTFSLEVPALVVEYADLNEVATDQIRGNSAAANQNKLGVLDYAKSGRRMIGYGMAPKVKENEFRQVCSGLEKGNSGAASRAGYLYALVDYYLTGLGIDPALLSCMFASEKVPGNEGEDPVKNPNFIPVSWVALAHADPMTDISVIARLLEVGLDKLSKYDSKYGSGSEAAKKDPSKSLMSAIETEVLKRGYSWNKEEAASWLKSRKPNDGGTPPVEQPKQTVFDPKQLEGLAASTAAPTVVNLLAKSIKAGTVLGDDPEMLKIQSAKQGLDAVFAGHGDATYQNLVIKAGLLREGAPEVFAAVAAKIETMLDKAIANIVKKDETPKAE